MRGTTGPVREVPVLLPATFAALTVTDVVGGLLDVAAGRSTLATAWSSRATLCAPWPMIAAQGVLTAATIRCEGTTGRVAAGLLALGCGVSLASGFFDGQLRRRDLSSSEVGFQVFLLSLTGLLGGLAARAALRE